MRFVMLRKSRCINCLCIKAIVELHVTRREFQVTLHVISYELEKFIVFLLATSETRCTMHVASHEPDVIKSLAEDWLRFIMLKKLRCINFPCIKVVIELHVTRHESQVLLTSQKVYSL